MPRVQVPVTTVERLKASLTTALSGADNDLVFTAVTGGPRGNDIRIAYVVAGNNTPLSVVVDGLDITVNVATDGGGAATSTASHVLAALQANKQVTALIAAGLAPANTGAGIVVAFALTNLAGGALGPVLPAATVGDPANDHYFTGNDGRVWLEVVSTDAGAQTVTFKAAANSIPGFAIADVVETIPAGAAKRIPPLESARFNQNLAGDVFFDPSANTLSFRACRYAV